MRIAVVGSGYVGLVTGACFAELGHDVLLVDNDEKKLDSACERARFRFTSDSCPNCWSGTGADGSNFPATCKRRREPARRFLLP